MGKSGMKGLFGGGGMPDMKKLQEMQSEVAQEGAGAGGGQLPGLGGPGLGSPGMGGGLPGLGGSPFGGGMPGIGGSMSPAKRAKAKAKRRK
jgi:signal recognition particle subunit SRP54